MPSRGTHPSIPQIRTHDPRPHCLLPSSSSSTVNPVSRSHQASIDSTTSLTCPTTIFISFQTNLISPFLPSSSPSHTSSHHLANCNQFDHAPTIQSNPYFLPAPVILVLRSFGPQSFSPPAPHTCKNSNQTPTLVPWRSSLVHQPLNPELRVLVHRRTNQQGLITSQKGRLASICLSPQSQHQISGGSCRQILFTTPLHQQTANSTRFHSFPAVS